MKIQIVNFPLVGIDDKAYRDLCNQLAPAFGAVPGLTAKLWLADPDANTYGGVYLWADTDAQAAFAESDLFAAVADHPNLGELNSRSFDLLPEPTAVTRGDRLITDQASV